MYLPTRAAKLNMYGMSWQQAEYAACICLLRMRKCINVVLFPVQQCCDGHHSMHAWLVQGTPQSKRHLLYSTLLAYQQDRADSNQLLVAAKHNAASTV